ncbi:MAG: chorismate-binding protein [Bacteroidetes bacterium]|nr:chorismate-binding protein [Bacteroidota bacterium]
MGYPSAVWRLPHTRKIKLLISVRQGIQKMKPDLETLPACFLLHPFATSSDDDVSMLEGDLIFTIADTGQIEDTVNKLGEEHPLMKQFLEKAAQISEKSNPEMVGKEWLFPAEATGESAEERFKDSVRQAITSIKAGDLTKIVLSRTKTLKHAEDFDPFQAFQKLHRAYPSAFVSLVNLPEQNEMWLGATPETLVSVDTAGIFRTTSLAGTQVAQQPNGHEEEIRDIRWGQKEIHEQALVSRYIVECFKKIRLREYHESGPKTVKAGNLYHLRTDFVVNTHEVNFPELGTVMLRLLHPTSAVCGTPKEAALQFISEKENYDRSFYSGYLGPVQVDQESALFVNLRTLRLSDGVATLFAGAGITEDSDPEREWEETEMKCETLLRVLI